jgi:hypothetical protein
MENIWDPTNQCGELMNSFVIHSIMFHILCLSEHEPAEHCWCIHKRVDTHIGIKEN